MTNIHPSMSRRRRGGFTLLELVVVIGILAILTGLLLPKFDVFKLKANKAVAASNMTDIHRIIQTYYVQNSVYPDQWDSLIDGTGLWTAATSNDPGLEPQLTGSPGVGNPNKLKTVTLTDDGDLRSLQRIGINNVYDFTSAADAAPNDTFTTPRAIAANGVFATLNIGAPGATGGDEDANAIVAHIYPALQPAVVDNTKGPVVPDGKSLVVFGFGSRNTAVGNIVAEVPFYPNTDVTKYYSRFLAVFEIGGGSRAELKAVLGADGDPIFDEMGDFFER